MIALRDAREVAAYVPNQFVAAAWDAQNPMQQPGILLAANGDDREHVVNHELTHVISFAILKNQPHWLAEGIVTYFEMADLESDKASVQAATLLRARRGHRRHRGSGLARGSSPGPWVP